MISLGYSSYSSAKKLYALQTIPLHAHKPHSISLEHLKVSASLLY